MVGAHTAVGFGVCNKKTFNIIKQIIHERQGILGANILKCGKIQLHTGAGQVNADEQLDVERCADR